MRFLVIVAAMVLTACAAPNGVSQTLTPTDTVISDPGGAANPPAQAVRTLVDFKGTGIKKSKKFTTSGDWTISYSFNCTSFGFAGNFIVDVEGDDSDVVVNELAKKGSDTVPEYLPPGTYYLDVNSECSWHVVAKG